MSNKKLNKAISKMSMNTIGKALKKLNLPIVSNCKHNVKNWNSERGTYLCSNCGKDFTADL